MDNKKITIEIETLSMLLTLNNPEVLKHMEAQLVDKTTRLVAKSMETIVSQAETNGIYSELSRNLSVLPKPW